MTSTSIEWTEVTWNPTTGCDRISPGCSRCYALAMAKRLKAMGSSKYQTDGDPRTSGPGFGVAVHQDVLGEPLRWRRPRMVFVNSMSDLGHARIDRGFVESVFAVMGTAQQHTFQVLTKRPRRLAKLLSDPAIRERIAQSMGFEDGNDGDHVADWLAVNAPWPLSNVWIGTSIESDEYCWRADDLRATPAAVRFLSLEPLLGPLPSLNLDGIDWVIVGGESGPGFTPLDLDWARDIRDRCQERSIPFFFKQVGGIRPKSGGRLLDGRIWDEMPSR
ncbi:phage Gp37/Gp68 family protein [Nocardia amamiensis]|uniref:Phage Gp37/Gp68 family protein n=1 Tax=Nocardia amamiensis TaxID=404578 RepID=A0ABS0D0C4_9NOCA|nr:phage Gp37/Gp68 family protein [Nocardia amamiensis]MBF6302274.1 phage Gp37/Gp68 family protein [Nocardia amamiensis]